jgi:Flp pilus assembly protein TadG
MRAAPMRRGRDEGGVVVEAALTITILLLLIIGIIQFAYAFYQWNTMALALQDVGRKVMVSYASTACDTTCAESAMQAILTSASASCASPSSPGAGQMCVNATTATGRTGAGTMTLTASYGLNLLTISPFTITAATKVPLE